MILTANMVLRIVWYAVVWGANLASRLSWVVLGTCCMQITLSPSAEAWCVVCADEISCLVPRGRSIARCHLCSGSEKIRNISVIKYEDDISQDNRGDERFVVIHQKSSHMTFSEQPQGGGCVGDE